VNRLSDVEKRRILCILVENPKRAECIQNLLTKHATIFKDSRIIDLQELVQFIQSTITTNRTHGDASTMTNTDQMCRQTTSCTSFIAQSENERRLKALEFIRIFIEKNEEDFCEYLINEEHLCQPKTLAIYQMIKQFLKVVYQAEHGQKQKAS
jgi:UDP-3-O-[3-hydroxymyristoyl] glucosamine N-acyltransferase